MTEEQIQEVVQRIDDGLFDGKWDCLFRPKGEERVRDRVERKVREYILINQIILDVLSEEMEKRPPELPLRCARCHEPLNGLLPSQHECKA